MASKKTRRYAGFTLVELIVVITILAIIATVGFLSLQGYSRDAGKSADLANLRTVGNGIETAATTAGRYPKPDNASTVTFSG